METIRRISFCPHCGNRAPQRLILTQEYELLVYDTDGTNPSALDAAYYVAVCETCNEILLYRAVFDIGAAEDFHHAKLIWPDAELSHPAVPKAVADCYAEAVRIKWLAPNAFAVQIRRALEALCDDRGARKGSLRQRLVDLVSRGEIPPVLAEMTDVLRLLGNIGAHAADVSVNPLHVWAIDEFFRAIVQYVYVAPSKLREFRSRLAGLTAKHESSDDA